MPQLDIATYRSQVFWVVTRFAGYYAVVSGNVLPTLAQALKTRARKMERLRVREGDLGHHAGVAHARTEKLGVKGAVTTTVLAITVEDFVNGTLMGQPVYGKSFNSADKLLGRKLAASLGDASRA